MTNIVFPRCVTDFSIAKFYVYFAQKPMSYFVQSDESEADRKKGIE